MSRLLQGAVVLLCVPDEAVTLEGRLLRGLESYWHLCFPSWPFSAPTLSKFQTQITALPPSPLPTKCGVNPAAGHLTLKALHKA